MNSAITKRSILIKGRKTSISLEDMFWHALKDIAAEQRVSATMLLVRIEQGRGNMNFSSAVRQFVMAHYINLVSDLRKAQGANGQSRPLEARAGTVTHSAPPTTLS